ncbi:MAG: TonB-dependent receptor [Mediterranea sp.]|nr:TonB-dependent receptor [Mediterranea sp.]
MNTFRFSQRSRYILLAGVLGLGSLTAQAVAADGKGANHAVAITQQSQTIKGTVVDNTGEPVIGANVLVKGTTTGVITDIDGNFTLEAPVGSTLVISFIGYETREVKATVAPMNIVLGDDAQALEEVVVVGYGVQKKATVTGSVSSVKGGELKAAGTANVTNTFAGKLPGVVAVNRSGEPGSDWSDILIRGKGSLNDNSPLIVIDGVANRSGLERLNPNDSESVNVLKDASAAIYGAQAANGVILITTKRGSSDKPVITYNGSFTLSQNTRTPNLMNAYECMTWTDEIRKGNGQAPLYENIKGGYLDGTINRDQYGDTDWMDVVFRNFAPSTRHSLSVAGGSEKVKFYVSGDYTYQEPNYRNTVFNFQTGQVRSNIDARIHDNLKIGVDLDVRKEKRNNSVISTGDIFWEAFMAYPWLYDYYPNGLPGPGLANGNNLAILVSGKDTGYDRVSDVYMNSKFSFELDMPWITEGLKLSGYAAFDYHAREEKQLWDVWDTYDYNANTGEYIKKTTNMNGNNISLNQSHDDNITRTYHLKLDWARTFGDHRLSAFVAYEQSEYEGEGFWAWRGYYLSNRPDYLNFGADKEKTNGGSGYVSARQNFFGRFNYTLMDRYMFEFTLRHDGSMNFAPNHRWGTFPGLSVGWRVSEEEWFKKRFDFVNDLKLRASWGKLGNDRVDAFQYLSTYDMYNGAILGETPNITKGFLPGRIGNPNITWEKVDSKNIAIDANLWNGLLGFTAEYFYQNRTDILTPKQASVPYYTGLSLPDQNIGEVSNQGVELMVTHRNHINDVNYHVSGNFTFTKNKIKFFDEAANTPEWQRRTGHAIDSWLMYKTDGIYQTWEEVNSTPHFANAQPGDIKYVDVDGDGAITDNDRIRSSIGNVPQIVFGLTLGAEWKGLEFSMLWTGQAKVKQMIVPYSYNLDKEFYNNRWISAEETPNAKYPRAFDKDDYENTRWSDFWLYDASFLRLKNMEIAYNLPKSLTTKLNVQNVRLALTGTNLLTFDHIKIQDPESSATSTGQAYPQARTYTFGVNISF